jgi:hypothetical protein
MIPKYIGNGKYCWEDAVDMLLRQIGETISPPYLEAISGCGIGAFFDKRTDWLYFNFAIPNEELTYDLKKLGFSIKDVCIPKTDESPVKELINDLKSSPIIVGPVNMGLLKYNPNYWFLNGSDYYILLYDCNELGFFIHDPAGLPCVYMSFIDFIRCWKSTNLAYGADFFHYWTKPKRISNPSKREIYVQTIKDYKSIYTNCDIKTKKNNWITGSDAIYVTAKRFEKHLVTDCEIEYYIYHGIQFATSCALNVADFLQPYNKRLAQIKYDEACLLGYIQSLTVAKKWELAARNLNSIAKLESEFRSCLFSS